MALRHHANSDEFSDRIDDLKSDITALSQDLRKRAGTQAAAVGGVGASLLGSLGLGGLLSQVEDLLGLVQHSGGGLARDARHRSGKAFRAVESTVEQNPVPVVAAAIAVGFLLGWMTRRSR